jgi:hypothetical protein
MGAFLFSDEHLQRLSFPAGKQNDFQLSLTKMM